MLSLDNVNAFVVPGFVRVWLLGNILAFLASCGLQKGLQTPCGQRGGSALAPLTLRSSAGESRRLETVTTNSRMLRRR